MGGGESVQTSTSQQLQSSGRTGPVTFGAVSFGNQGSGGTLAAAAAAGGGASTIYYIIGAIVLLLGYFAHKSK